MIHYHNLIKRSAVHAVNDGLHPQEVALITKNYLDEVGVDRIINVPASEMRKVYAELSVRFGEALHQRMNPV